MTAILLSLVSSLMWGMSDFAGGLLSKRRPAVVVVGIGACVGVGLATVGVLFHDGRRDQFGAGDLLFVAAGTEHRFEDYSDDLAVWVIFYGPQNGEIPQ